MEKIQEKLSEIEKEYNELQEGLEEYVVNKIKYNDLKKRGSKFGIYEQKGKTMMLRLKAVGGELSIRRLRDLEQIMKDQKIPYIHLSTRQNYQLHEVDFANVKATIEECNSKGMYFRGGGGNTFRSILVSTYTGVSKINIFDVMPYARMVENEVFFYDKAFDFGRKLKIGFANNTEDEFVVSIQDLGFIAHERNGERGFRVYVGGGMGRNSRLGHILVEFLPEKDLLKAVFAVIDIFYDHGERHKRGEARLRFLVEKMGIENFRSLFKAYFSLSAVENGKISPIPYDEKIAKLVKFPDNNEILPGFEDWKNICVKETRFKDIVSVALYVENGNLPLEKLGKLNKLMAEIGAASARATINQNLVIPLVHKSALPFIFEYLHKEIPEVVTVTISNRGQLRACVGSKTCMIGIQDSQGVADAVGLELDKLAAKYPQYRDIILKEVKNIRISGCGSMCAGVPIAPLGFVGMKKLVDGNKLIDAMQVYMGGILLDGVEALAIEMKDMALPLDEIPAFVSGIFEEYLESYQNHNITFTKYMYFKRKGELLF